MRRDDELLKAHAEERTRQQVRLAAARRADADRPLSLSDMPRAATGRIALAALALATICNLLLMIDAHEYFGGSTGGALYVLPFLLPPLMLLLIDRQGRATAGVHMLMGLIVIAMLMLLPLAISLLVNLSGVDVAMDSALVVSLSYLGIMTPLLPYYLLAALLSAPLAGWLLRRLFAR